MISQYSMLIQWSPEDDVYVVSLPEFGPYARTHGSTYEEAARMGAEVIELLIDSLKAEGRKLPHPRVLDLAAECAHLGKKKRPKRRLKKTA